MKKAILIASFGTADPTAIHKCIYPLEQAAAEAFPDWTVLRCFTSAMVIRRLAQQGICVPSLTESLRELARNGFQKVVIFPTLLAPGGEYEKLLTAAESYSSVFSSLTIGQTLLSREENLRFLADYLAREYPLSQGEALLLMGHGSEHSGNPELKQLAALLPETILPAALTGQPSFSDTLGTILARGFSRVTLVPLMLTAGTHAARHLSGPQADSWLSRCREAGLQAECRLTGLGESPQVRRLYLRQLSDAISEK